jgi:hypothetical protein
MIDAPFYLILSRVGVPGVSHAHVASDNKGGIGPLPPEGTKDILLGFGPTGLVSPSAAAAAAAPRPVGPEMAISFEADVTCSRLVVVSILCLHGLDCSADATTHDTATATDTAHAADAHRYCSDLGFKHTQVVDRNGTSMDFAKRTVSSVESAVSISDCGSPAHNQNSYIYFYEQCSHSS